jgi:hypothetical protein
MTISAEGADAPIFAVRGWPRALLRLAGAAAMTGAAVVYWKLGYGWPMFLILFLAPDLSMLGYLAGRRVGASAYNLAHSYVGPVVLAAVGAFLRPDLWWTAPVALIWAAHVGFDRMLGYGLKYGTGFGDTHLGRVGRLRRST